MAWIVVIVDDDKDYEYGVADRGIWLMIEGCWGG
jgi:hypothetical protein